MDAPGKAHYHAAMLANALHEAVATAVRRKAMKHSRISTRLIVLVGMLITLVVALGDLVLGVVFGVGFGIWIARTIPRKYPLHAGHSVASWTEPCPPAGQPERRRDTRRPPDKVRKEFDTRTLPAQASPASSLTTPHQGTVKRMVSYTADPSVNTPSGTVS